MTKVTFPQATLTSVTIVTTPPPQATYTSVTLVTSSSFGAPIIRGRFANKNNNQPNDAIFHQPHKLRKPSFINRSHSSTPSPPGARLHRQHQRRQHPRTSRGHTPGHARGTLPISCCLRSPASSPCHSPSNKPTALFTPVANELRRLLPVSTARPTSAPLYGRIRSIQLRAHTHPSHQAHPHHETFHPRSSTMPP